MGPPAPPAVRSLLRHSSPPTPSIVLLPFSPAASCFPVIPAVHPGGSSVRGLGGSGASLALEGRGFLGGGADARGPPPWAPPTGRAHLASWKRSEVRGWYLSRAAMRSKAEGASMVTRDTTTLTCPERARPPESRLRGLPCPPSRRPPGQRALRGWHRKPPPNPRTAGQLLPGGPRHFVLAETIRNPRGSPRPLRCGRSGPAPSPPPPCRPAHVRWPTEGPQLLRTGKGPGWGGGWNILRVRGRALSRGLCLALPCLPFR